MTGSSSPPNQDHPTTGNLGDATASAAQVVAAVPSAHAATNAIAGAPAATGPAGSVVTAGTVQADNESGDSTGTFQCRVCSRAFGNNSNLLRHMAVHTGERRHACATCDAAFTTLPNLRRHVMAKHPLAAIPSTSRAASRSRTPSPATPTGMGFPSFVLTTLTGGTITSQFQDPGHQRHPPPAASSAPGPDMSDGMGSPLATDLHFRAENTTSNARALVTSPVASEPPVVVAPGPLPHSSDPVAAITTGASATPASGVSRFQCPHCPKIFAYRTSLQYHMRQRHFSADGTTGASPTTTLHSGAVAPHRGNDEAPEAQPPNSTNFMTRGALEVECPHCYTLLSSRTKLNRHLQKHCVFRHESDVRRRNRGELSLFDDDRSRAPDGGPSFRREPAPASHAIEDPYDHGNGDCRRKLHRCEHDGCFATFARPRGLRAHIANKHSVDGPKDPAAAD